MGIVRHSGPFKGVLLCGLCFLGGEPLEALHPWPDARTGNSAASVAMDIDGFFAE
jgi:hypothetical protein